MNTRAHLLEETRQAWDGSSPLRQVVEPSPGDIVALSRMGRFDVEWAVLDRDPARPPTRHPHRPGRLLVVAADGQPLVGSTDVEVPASAPGGPLVLRCAFGGWVNAGLFTAATRTGTLAAGDVECARDRLEESRANAIAGSVLTQEVDDDTEYRAWTRETLEPAWRALTGGTSIHEVTVLSEVRPSARGISPPRRPRPMFNSRLFALAATLLLAFGATFFWRQHQELREHRDIVREQEHEAARFKQVREQLAAEYRRELEAAGAERQRFESESRRQIDELDRRLDDALSQAVVENPLVTSLDPGGRRGQGKLLRLHAAASHVLLAVTLKEPKPGQRYRAELLDRTASRTLWVSGELRQELRGLWIGLPAALLPPGEYLLRIHELGESDPEPAVEYPLRVQGDD